MPTAWSGADPVAVVDGDNYELGTQYRAVVDITITHVRIWAGASEVDSPARRARVWTTAGVQLGIATLNDNLPTGWTEYALDTPVEATAGTNVVVSYSTGGNYAIVSGAMVNNVVSADGNVVAVRASQSANGNGVFNGAIGSFPATASPSDHWYGPDFVYTVGIGGNTAPEITALTAEANGAVVTATVAYDDAEDLTGSTTRFAWGDATSDTVVTYPTRTAQHTYATSGLYAVLATVTDSLAAADHAAVPVNVTVPSAGVVDFDAAPVLAALVTHIQALGLFDHVNQHQPDNAPGHGLTTVIWPTKLSPIRGRSGLDVTSVRLPFVIRISSSLSQVPADTIDPQILTAASKLMGAYIGDFTLGGLISNVDVHAAHGPGLDADLTWWQHGENRYRVALITVPLIINNLWEQVP